MAVKYDIQTLADLNERISSFEKAGKFITKEQAESLFKRVPYGVLKEFMDDILYHDSIATQEEKRNWLVKNIVLLLSEEISLNAYLHAKYQKKVAETVTDAETAIKALAEAKTREEMKCILESLSYEELEKVEKGSLAEFVKKTNLINLIISYVEYSKSVNSGGCAN